MAFRVLMRLVCYDAQKPGNGIVLWRVGNCIRSNLGETPLRYFPVNVLGIASRQRRESSPSRTCFGNVPSGGIV